jgi:hypothetical protein
VDSVTPIHGQPVTCVRTYSVGTHAFRATPIVAGGQVGWFFGPVGSRRGGRWVAAARPPARCARGSLRLGARPAVVVRVCLVWQGRPPWRARLASGVYSSALWRCRSLSGHYTFVLALHHPAASARPSLASALGSGRQKLSTYRCPPVGLHLLWQLSTCGDGQRTILLATW